MNYIKSLFTIFAMCGCLVSASAATDVDSLMAIADNAPSNAVAHLNAGKALYNQGDRVKAKTYLSRGGNDAKPWLAMIEFDNYNFGGARDMAEAYLESKHNENSAEHSLAEELIGRTDLASTMLDRVEKVVVLDSVLVDKTRFFEAIRLSEPTGRITGSSVLPAGTKASDPTTVFVSENGERMLWGADDDNGLVHLVSSTHLADGSWEAPHAVGDDLGLGGDANFPFLLSDGVTLYYASDGEGSLGGYDIFVTRNNGEKFLNPQNIGMPYNSPYDDYLLAIDDATGVGWWVTDRNQIPNQLTVYMFVPQELRDNYPVDGTPDLINRARLSSIADTQRKGEDYSKYFDAVNALQQNAGAATDTHKFMFALPDGRVITAMGQFTEPEARDMMECYLEALDDFNASEKQLADLRKAFAGGNRSLSDRILKQEVELEQKRIQLRALANDVVKAEIR